MMNRHWVHLWRQMKIHRILTHVCLHQIGCLYYCCYAKTSSSAVQKRHSKVYGNLIAPSFYSILLAYMPLCGTQNSIINSNRKKNIINPFLFFMYIYLFLIYMLQLMMYETRTGFLVLLNPFNDYFLYFPGMY